jgi:AcrR family transcriptional regulator
VLFEIEQTRNKCSENLPMQARKPDRRVARTRELVLDAFRTLMVDRGYEKITVQQILDRSGVGRATFYAHFKSKHELMSASVGRLQAGLRNAWQEEARRSRRAAEPLGFSLAFLQHVNSHRRIYDQVVGKSSELTMDRHMRRMLAELAREDLLSRPGVRRNSKALEVAAQFVSGALWSLVVWWLSTQSRLSPEELNAHFRNLILRGLDG